MVLIFSVKLHGSLRTGKRIPVNHRFYTMNCIKRGFSVSSAANNLLKRTTCNMTAQKYLCYSMAQPILDWRRPTLKIVVKADGR